MSVVMSSHLVSDLERICDYLVVLVAARIQVAGPVTDVVASHHLVSGPSVDRSGLPADAEIISAVRNLGQTTVLVRAAAAPQHPAWVVTRPNLEDVVLAYMSRAGEGAAAGPAAARHSDGGSTMTWLTFRQFRAQAIAALAALAVLAVAYGTTGSHLVHLYNASGMRGCGNGPACLSRASTFIDAMKADQVYPALFFVGMVILVILPAIIGAFWGAPLVARELETGTYRLAWNQDVTRTRWMAVKLGGVGLAAIATSGLLSLLFSWWAGPINAAGGFPNNFSQFVRMTPLMFASQGIVPAAWAALAFVLGVVAGILVRRTIAAMAITIVVVALLQILWPHFVRPHLLAADRATAPITAVSLNSMLVSNHERGHRGHQPAGHRAPAGGLGGRGQERDPVRPAVLPARHADVGMREGQRAAVPGLDRLASPHPGSRLPSGQQLLAAAVDRGRAAAGPRGRARRSRDLADPASAHLTGVTGAVAGAGSSLPRPRCRDRRWAHLAGRGLASAACAC